MSRIFGRVDRRVARVDEPLAIPCTTVRIACVSDTWIPGLFGRTVSEGEEVAPGCVVSFTRPASPCVVTPTTSVTVSRRVEVKVIDEGRYVVILFGNKPFVYWAENYRLVDKVISSVMRGLGLATMIIALGPPGTGKSSLGKILAETMGVYVREIDTSSTFSMWFGESERRLSEALMDLKRNQPALGLIDEGDAFVKSRYSGYRHEVEQNLVNILLRFTSDVAKSGDRVLIYVASNMPMSMIDEAFLRPERAFAIEFKPLDYEGFRLLGRYYVEYAKLGLSEQEVDRLALAAANMMADTSMFVNMLKGLIDVREAIINQIRKSRGVKSYVVPNAEKYVDVDCSALRSNARFYVDMRPASAASIIVAAAAARCGMQNIVIRSSDPETVKYAADRAELIPDTVLILETPIHPEVYYNYVYWRSMTVVHTAETPPPTSEFRKLHVVVKNVEALANELARLYGVQIDEREPAAARLARLSRAVPSLP